MFEDARCFIPLSSTARRHAIVALAPGWPSPFRAVTAPWPCTLRHPRLRTYRVQYRAASTTTWTTAVDGRLHPLPAVPPPSRDARGGPARWSVDTGRPSRHVPRGQGLHRRSRGRPTPRRLHSFLHGDDPTTNRSFHLCYPDHIFMHFQWSNNYDVAVGACIAVTPTLIVSSLPDGRQGPVPGWLASWVVPGLEVAGLVGGALVPTGPDPAGSVTVRLVSGTRPTSVPRRLSLKRQASPSRYVIDGYHVARLRRLLIRQ